MDNSVLDHLINAVHEKIHSLEIARDELIAERDSRLKKRPERLRRRRPHRDLGGAAPSPLKTGTTDK
jgi:hypothetical protein